jgi:16S rRNA (adenine1518-N6/adenine1519-N6)-dimethyltransferase
VTAGAGTSGAQLPAPRKRFGQHFLHDPQVIARIVAAVALAPGERLVEIGPGRGAITRALLDRHGQLTVIEFDRDLAAYWRQVAASELPGLTPIEQDVLRVDWTLLAQAGPLVVVGNLPYNISTAIIFGLLETQAPVSDMLFMVQREVAQRIAARPGSSAFGRLSVMVQQHCEVESVLMVGPGAFQPPPKVDSAVIRLTPRPLEQRRSTPRRFGEVVASAFQTRRKTLRNSLRTLMDAEALEAAGVDPGDRAEQLSVQDFVRIAHLLDGVEDVCPTPERPGKP